MGRLIFWKSLFRKRAKRRARRTHYRAPVAAHRAPIHDGFEVRITASKTHGVELLEPVTLAQEEDQDRWIVTVFDNDHNTYEQVMTVLMLATGCAAEEAYIEAWEVDHMGSSLVHQASESECREAAKIIGTIGIRVEATPEWAERTV